MPANIIDGRKIRDSLMVGLVQKVSALSFKPTLAIIQVGERADSTSFIRAKKSFAAKIGVHVMHIQMAERIRQNEAIDIIKGLNADPTVHGIIVQLPLPLSLDKDAVIEAIHPSKDVDALTSRNVKNWLTGTSIGGLEDERESLMPATAKGIRTLLYNQGINLNGKMVTIIGRSMLVGKPIAAMCINENATVTICHSKTADLPLHTKPADILVVAAGKAGLIRRDHVREGQIVIDVGINSIEDNKMTGDVHFDDVSQIVSHITPVPGGVGPMTVFSLFENLIDVCAR